MPTFLIGYMASGKTTLGEELANHLNLSFIDFDVLIEKKIEMSIFDFFQTQGESVFRNIENSIIRNYRFQRDAIVATGGGTPCFHNNHQLLSSLGTTIYLKVSVEEIVRRLEFNDKRPIIFDNKLNLRSFVSKQILEREKYYLKSDYIIESDSISVDLLLKEINILK